MSLIVDIEKKMEGFELKSKFETGSGIMALLGASGCGKSVTLKCIAGIMTPDRGHIELDGRVLFDSEKKINLTPQERNVGYLFQNYALFPNMTVLQNIMCSIRSGNKAEKKQKGLENLKRFKLDGLENKYPAQLSGGQQQRVALARILVSEPKAILLDEPFSALDSYLKFNLEFELDKLLSEFEGPVIWVSHDLGECYRNCSSVCVMEKGKTGDVTDMDTLLLHPGSGSAAMITGCRNFVRGQKKDGGVYLPSWDVLLSVKSEKDDMTVAIPDRAFDMKGNMFRGKVLKRICDIDKDVLMVCCESSGDETLSIPIQKDLDIECGSQISFGIKAEDCICY